MPAPPPGAYPSGTQLVVGSHSVVVKKFLSVGGYAQVYVVYMDPPFADGNQIACLKRVMVPDKIQLNLLRAEVSAMVCVAINSVLVFFFKLSTLLFFSMCLEICFLLSNLPRSVFILYQLGHVATFRRP